MKKLMTILGATATLFASCVVHGEAEPWETGTSFENYAVDFNPQLNDSGVAGDTYWYTGDTAPTFVLTNYEGEATTTTPIDKRPDKFKNDVNATYLMIETSSPDTPLFRTALPYIGGYSGDDVGKFSPVTNTADRTVYLDTLVKFTESDSVFEKNLSNGDKIAIEYVVRDEELDPNDASIVKVHGLTNFVIRAGYIGGAQTNYVAKLPANFDKDAWHRLTVRTVLNIDGNNSVGFVIYVDEEALEYDTEAIARTGEFAEAAGVAFSASGLAANFYQDGHRAIYPSVIQSGTEKYTISAAGFAGNGAVDDVTFSAKVDFIEASEQVPVTFTVPTGVAAITVDGVAIDLANPTTNLEANVETFDLVVTVDSANGYTFAGISGAETNAEGKVIVQKPAMAITILTSRNNVSYINDSDETVYCATLSEAFENAKSGSTITLPYNGAPFTYIVADWEEAGFESYRITGNITLDLNGNVINGGVDTEEAALFEIPAGNTLTVIDSSSGNTGAISYTTQYGVFYAKGACTIGAVSGDYGPTITGYLAAVGDKGDNVWLVRGKFDVASNGTSEFLWTDNLGDEDGTITSTAAPSGSYWVVAPESTPEPVVIPTYELTLPSVTGASAEVTSNDVVVADLTAIPSNTAVVVTWTAQEGYKITAGATENITMDSAKTAAAPTVAAIQYATLTIESVANCTIVVSNATAEVATGAKFDKADAVQLTVYRTPAEGYELDNCAATETITMDQDQTVTAAVKQSGGDYPSYIPTEDAEVKAKYDTWAATYGADAGGAYEDAFLLNIAPDAEDQTLEPASITIVDGKIVIEANKDLDAVNGKVYIKTAATLSGLESASWAEATLDKDGAIEMTPNATGAFFKIKVDF